MLKLILNLHFFQALQLLLVVLLGLAGHCLPVQSRETEKVQKREKTTFQEFCKISLR